MFAQNYLVTNQTRVTKLALWGTPFSLEDEEHLMV